MNKLCNTLHSFVGIRFLCSYVFEVIISVFSKESDAHFCFFINKMVFFFNTNRPCMAIILSNIAQVYLRIYCEGSGIVQV